MLNADLYKKLCDSFLLIELSCLKTAETPLDNLLLITKSLGVPSTRLTL